MSYWPTPKEVADDLVYWLLQPFHQSRCQPQRRSFARMRRGVNSCYAMGWSTFYRPPATEETLWRRPQRGSTPTEGG